MRIYCLISIAIACVLISCSDSGIDVQPTGMVKGNLVFLMQRTLENGLILGEMRYTQELDSVQLILHCGCKEEQTVYSKDGKYEFKNVPKGSYLVKAKIGDYVYYLSNNFQIKGNDTATIDTMFLKKYNINPEIKIKFIPNPVTSDAIMEYPVVKKDSLSIYLVDLQGKIIKTVLSKYYLLPGKYMCEPVKNSDIPSGLYFAIIKNYDEQNPYLAFIPFVKQ